ncbi:putative peptidyl-prolyl cis-trans isomerase d, ppid [Corchorus capsularis]|uniref:Putative peptidyl-prolyl cis-trans isomerase d, ppid n=1 Tax=Corchorus capsularis TaxID=210143 RepID=A0A1R3GFQ5_COCAP|nr:putative peptidyl-prolyl cis-trans isomerase d, ppid [Corchorus capsularis]
MHIYTVKDTIAFSEHGERFTRALESSLAKSRSDLFTMIIDPRIMPSDLGSSLLDLPFEIREGQNISEISSKVAMPMPTDLT